MVRLEGSIKRYVGASTDQKPQPGVVLDGVAMVESDLPPGSSFLEGDTGRIWRWNGIEWRDPALADEVVPLLQAILAQVTALRETQEIVASKF